ncbi:MAG TPA: beta galactosidase jelly roll domain-containing protein, partial [Solirubrobacteraceae bacterium]|nr:beta galactosidase jelly roll domain-containing protein [Solirubrobacteraceae bacterium]
MLLPTARSLTLTALLGLAVVTFPAGAGAAPRAHTSARAVTPTRAALTRDGWTNRYLLDGAWLYRADSSGSGLRRRFYRDTASTAGWSAVRVPNSYNASTVSTSSFYGTTGWYRKDFYVPRGPVGEQWIVRFESVNYRAEVWLNGRLLGSHVGAFLPFELGLSGLRPDAVNHLVVRVDNHLGPGDLPAGPYRSRGTPAVGGWWNYGGILGDVYLRPVQEANLEQVIVRP